LSVARRAAAVLAGDLTALSTSCSSLRSRSGGLKADSNEVAIEGFWLGSNDALEIAGRARDVDVWEPVR